MNRLKVIIVPKNSINGAAMHFINIYAVYYIDEVDEYRLYTDKERNDFISISGGTVRWMEVEPYD